MRSFIFFIAAFWMVRVSAQTHVSGSISIGSAIYHQRSRPFIFKDEDPFSLPFRTGHVFTAAYTRHITPAVSGSVYSGYGFFPKSTSNLGGITVQNKTRLIPAGLEGRYGFMIGKVRVSLEAEAGMHLFSHNETVQASGGSTKTQLNKFHYGYGVRLYYGKPGLLPDLEFKIIQAGSLTFQTFSLNFTVYRFKK